MSDILKTDLRLVKQLDTSWDIISWDKRKTTLAQTITDNDNLAQALRSRFMTETGELADLSHPDYGSTRLRDFIGEGLTQASRIQLEKVVSEIILAEPRVAEIVSLIVSVDAAQSQYIDVTASVKSIDGEVVDLNINVNV